MKWNNFDRKKPTRNGRYLVCWSEPYAKNMKIDIGCWINDRFVNEIAGANEVLFWSEIKSPFATRELRTRRCQKT